MTNKESTVLLAAFRDELEQIVKEGGLKDVLLKEIPGTKPWILGNASLASQASKPVGSAALKTLKRPRTGQLSSGAWDVSRQAQAMGL